MLLSLLSRRAPSLVALSASRFRPASSYAAAAAGSSFRPASSSAAAAAGSAFKLTPAAVRPCLPPNAFAGASALVTGGGTGLGYAIAATLASLGADVTLASRNDAACEAAAIRLNAELVAAHAPGGAPTHLTPLAGVGTPGTARGVGLDVTDGASVAAAFDAAAERGGFSIVVNNAAANFVSPAERVSARGFAAIAGPTLHGPWAVSTEAARRWFAGARGGVVLNILATYADGGSAFVAASAASKGGLRAMTKSLAAEWGRRGVRVCALVPGPVETDGAFSRLDPSGSFRERLRARLPARRLGEAGEIANAAAFLASDHAAWVTGACWEVDGGETVGLAGAFNALEAVSPDEWAAIEATVRAGKGKGRGAAGGERAPPAA